MAGKETGQFEKDFLRNLTGLDGQIRLDERRGIAWMSGFLLECSFSPNAGRQQRRKEA